MKLNPLFPTRETLGINTDLYELTMAAAYFESGRMADRGTFELFTRRLPQTRNFLMAAGLEQALHFVQNVRFSEETLKYLRQLDTFKPVNSAFFDYLRDFRFSGDIHALPEGTIFFTNQPILQATAPIIEAQVLETYLMSTVNFQSMVASKAARVCHAAQGRSIVDFGSRRAHSPQAGVLAARASFIGGCAGTSNVLAGYEMGIPVYGTMAHSFVQFFDRESEAFQRFWDVFGEDSTLLVDTYDSLAGVQKALDLGEKIQAVRLDSGDLLALAFKTRELLDRQGRKDVQIVASGNLNEEKLQSFSLANAPIDAYGVGTDLVVSTDAPTCDLVYKLVEISTEGKTLPRIKTSEGKETLPFRKQIYRRMEKEGFGGDLLSRSSEQIPEDPSLVPLLRQYVQDGQMMGELPDLSQIQAYAREQLSLLPASLKSLDSSEEYPVQYSKELVEIQKELEKEHG